MGTGKETTAARSLARVSTITEFFRGSRVEDYEPLFQLSTRISSANFLGLLGSQQQIASEDTSLPRQILRFLAAILAGHGQKVIRGLLPECSRKWF